MPFPCHGFLPVPYLLVAALVVKITYLARTFDGVETFNPTLQVCAFLFSSWFILLLLSTILSVPPGFHAAYGLTARVPDLLRHQIAYWHPSTSLSSCLVAPPSFPPQGFHSKMHSETLINERCPWRRDS